MNYIGSIIIYEYWMLMGGLYEYEKVHVLNINNGERFEMYVIKCKNGNHDIILTGAAARKLQTGDLVIIMAYAHIDSKDYKKFKPKIVYAVDYYK